MNRPCGRRLLDRDVHTTRRTARLRGVLGVLSDPLVLVVCLPALWATPPQKDAHPLMAAIGRPQGLVVVLGGGGGELAAALGKRPDCLVQALDTDPKKVEAARQFIQSQGVYGRVSVRVFDGRHLPYVDNLVNLLVVRDGFELPREEMLRVLAPLGRLCVEQDGRWTTTLKPWPDEIDEWTHFLHGPDNNAVGRDRRADVPRSLQWVAGPRWARSHEELASMSAAATARGRIYYIIDEGPMASIRYPADWKLVARDAFNGTLLWTRPLGRWVDPLRHFRSGPAHLPRRLVAAGDRVYATLDLAGPVVALDGATGELLREYKGTEYTEEILLADGVLYLVVGSSEVDRRGGGLFERGEPEPAEFEPAEFRRLMAVEAESGKQLWQRDFTAEFILPLSLAVRGSRVYCQTTRGAPVGMVHHRCYRDKATERFIFSGWSGVEIVSLETGWLCNNSWLRGTCQYGIVPANGLLYVPPDACACFLTVKAPGFFAAAPQRDPTLEMPFPERPVVEKGPLYGKLPASRSGSDPADWPAFRHDALRSGMAGCPLPEKLAPRWSVELGGRLTQPVAAGNRVYVAAIDAHTVYALDADEGKQLWSFTADGRIDSPPTVYRGAVIFGSADGWVYCLSAENGQLVWRFQAAPAERVICAYGQPESIWPVHGAVLVQNDMVYASAGRSSYLDGGIVLYRLDPNTGRPLSHTVLHHLDPKTGRQLAPEAGFNMEGTAGDVLTGDGQRVYLKYFAFDASGQRTNEGRPHLFSITSLLGEEWFVRTYWVLGEGKPGAGWNNWANAAKRFPFGRILCFDDQNVFGYGREKIEDGRRRPVGHQAEAYHLFCRQRRPRRCSTVSRARAAGCW